MWDQALSTGMDSVMEETLDMATPPSTQPELIELDGFLRSEDTSLGRYKKRG